MIEMQEEFKNIILIDQENNSGCPQKCLEPVQNDIFLLLSLLLLETPPLAPREDLLSGNLKPKRPCRCLMGHGVATIAWPYHVDNPRGPSL